MVRVRITNRGDAAGQLWSLLRAHHFESKSPQEPVSPSLVESVISSGRDVLGDQTIYSAGNNIYVDGRRLPQPYLPPHGGLGPPIPAATRQAPFHVPRGDLYVMGDNRQISCDSRFWGAIKGTSVVGRAVLLFWHNGDPDLHLF